MSLDASRQPGDLQDLMLHETAVAWVTARLCVTTPKREWEETENGFTTRIIAACQYVNDNFDVEGLCEELPGRLAKLLSVEGARIGK